MPHLCPQSPQWMDSTGRVQELTRAISEPKQCHRNVTVTSLTSEPKPYHRTVV